MEKIKMGIIGIGDIAEAHIEGIKASPDAELIAICDTNEELLKIKGDKNEIPSHRRFTSYLDLLKCKDIDAVSICTPNNSHYEITANAIKFKKHFVLEKPVSLNYKEAMEIKKLLESENILNMVCFSYRFKAAARYAKWFIGNGKLGDIRHVYVQYFQGWAANEQVPLIWRFSKEISGSGALGDLGSHMIDMIRFLIGDFKSVCGHMGNFIEKRKKVDSDEYGVVDVDDYCHFMAEIDGNVAATFAITRDAFGRGNYQRIEVYGSKGGLIYNLDDEESIEICIGDIYGQICRYYKIPVPVEYKAGQMQSFFDLLKGNSDGIAAVFDDGLRSQQIIDGIIESSEKGNWVTFG